MSPKTKAMTVPDIGNLLGQISKKRESGELPKTERQHVAPVPSKTTLRDKTFKRLNDKTIKRANDAPPLQTDEEMASTAKPTRQKAMGRPTLKSGDITYDRLGVKVPKHLKQKLRAAIANEEFTTTDGRTINTMDELVTLAIEKLFGE